MEITVLLVDDDPVVLFLHQMLVKKSGCAPETLDFKDGRQALDFILHNREKAPFLILLDINMPVMDGWEFLEAIQEVGSKEDFFVAIVSSSINKNDIHKAGEYPQVIDYLEKPLSRAVLLQLFEKISTLVFKG